MAELWMLEDAGLSAGTLPPFSKELTPACGLPARMLDVALLHVILINSQTGAKCEWVYYPLFLSPVTIYFYEQRNSSRA